MKHWLMKSEEDEYPINWLKSVKKTAWTGVRNYAARNFMRDGMQVGDGVLFYHSSCALPGVAGLAEVSKAAYPDPTQFDPKSPYYDPKAAPAAPRWFCVDITWKKNAKATISGALMKETPGLGGMMLFKLGRLSITPVTDKEWKIVTGMKKFWALALALGLGAGASAMGASELAAKLKAPQGWSVSLFAEHLPQARAMAQGSDGTIYVGSKSDSIYALRDEDGDGKAEKSYVIAKGLNSPIGLDIKGADLYVSSLDSIQVIKGIQGKLADPPKRGLFADLGTPEGWHGGKVIRFGPDGKLYVPVGSPCNTCVKPEPYGRMNVLENGKLRAIASGIRNTVGFDWEPASGELWFTDNGRDMLGDDKPPCELNRVRAPGLSFGFPYFHGDGIKDPEYGKSAPKGFKYEKPAWNFRAHNAPLGMRFGRLKQSQGFILACLHGSWNRSKKDGYKVVRLAYKDGKVLSQEDFLTGFLRGQSTLGRPVDVLELKDGSWLVSDDDQGAVYRVSPNFR